MIRLTGEGQEAGPAVSDLPYVARAHLVCAECRHGQPACDHVRLRRGDGRTLGWCSLRAASMRLRFAQIRPHLY